MKRLLVFLVTVVFFAPLSSMALTLGEGLRIVVDKGRDVTISRSSEDEARAAISLARAPWLPSVDLYGNQTWLRYQPEFTSPLGSFAESQDRYFSYGVHARQLLYDFGRTSSSIDAAQLGLKSRQIETEGTKNQSALDFIISYLDLLESEKLLGVAKEEVQLHEAHKKDSEALFNAGVVTKNEVLQADVTLADARQRAVTADNLRSLRASRINSLLLRLLNDDVQAEEVKASPATGITLESAWTMAANESPDLRALNVKIEASEDKLKMTQAEYMPTVYLSGGYDYQQNRYMVHDENWSLIAGVNINLFSGGATSSRMQMARSELRSLQLIRDKLLDNIQLEVKSAYLDLQSSSLKMEVTKTAIEQAQENLRLQRLRYREGEGTSTDVLDAVTLLTTAESNSWKALYDQKRAEARLLYSMGRNLADVYGN
jgi:outer membrane protein